MSVWEFLLEVLEVAACAAIVGAFFVYWRQLRAMTKTLSWTAESTRNQNPLNLVMFLSREPLSMDRATTIQLGKTCKPYVEWSEDERLAVERVCASYDLAGLMFEGQMIPGNVFVTAYEDSLRKCYAGAKPLLDVYRKERGRGYWSRFDRLVEATQGSAWPQGGPLGCRPRC